MKTFHSYMSIIGVHLILLNNVKSFVVLTADIADIKKIAQKLVPKMLTDRLSNIVSQVTGQLGDDDNINNSNDKRYGMKNKNHKQKKLSDENQETDEKSHSIESISFENLKYDPKKELRNKYTESKQQKIKKTNLVQKTTEYRIKESTPHIFSDDAQNEEVIRIINDSQDETESHKIKTTDTSVEKNTKEDMDSSISSTEEVTITGEKKDKARETPNGINESSEDTKDTSEGSDKDVKINVNQKQLQDFSDDEISKILNSNESSGVDDLVTRDAPTTSIERNEFDQYVNNPRANAISKSDNYIEYND